LEVPGNDHQIGGKTGHASSGDRAITSGDNVKKQPDAPKPKNSKACIAAGAITLSSELILGDILTLAKRKTALMKKESTATKEAEAAIYDENGLFKSDGSFMDMFKNKKEKDREVSSLMTPSDMRLTGKNEEAEEGVKQNGDDAGLFGSDEELNILFHLTLP